MPKPAVIFLGAVATWIAWAHAAAEPEPRAAEPAGLEAVPEPVDIPPRVKSGETLEPEVTIRREPEQTITEYRINGQVHSVKVEPDFGPTYWMVDTTGDGFAETRYDNFEPPFAIPGWIIFQW